MILFKDRRGGEVDTINTVRDNTVTDYASSKNQENYDKRGEYDYNSYHKKNENYRKIRKETSELQRNSNLVDAYTGKKMDPNKIGDLDHIVSAKATHDDPGRVLAGISGEDIANMDENLVKTHRSVNRSKGKMDPVEYADLLDSTRTNRTEEIKLLKKRQISKEFTGEDKKELEKLEQLNHVDTDSMRSKSKKVKAAQDSVINQKYYRSRQFCSQTAFTVTKSGIHMGIREVAGFIIMDTWIVVEEEIPILVSEMKEDFSFGEFINGLKEIFISAYGKVSSKWKEYTKVFSEGSLAGSLSSITSIALNMFQTTFATAGRIIRQSWSSIIEAVKILIFNPESLPYGEVLRSVFKIIGTTASVIAGVLVQENLSKFTFSLPPSLQSVIPAFAGSMLSGLLSVSLLYFFDNSKLVKKLVDFANNIRDEFDVKLEYYGKVVDKLIEFVAEMEGIDYEKLEAEVKNVSSLFDKLSKAENIDEENTILRNNLKSIGIEMPYETKDERDNFMMDKSSVLTI